MAGKSNLKVKDFKLIMSSFSDTLNCSLVKRVVFVGGEFIQEVEIDRPLVWEADSLFLLLQFILKWFNFCIITSYYYQFCLLGK